MSTQTRIIAAAVLLLTPMLVAQNKGSTGSHHEQLIWQPPRISFQEEAARATVPKPMVTSLQLGRADISLEKTMLSDIQRLFGATTGHQGDASEYVAWLCFYGNDDGGRYALWLESSEMGGGTIDGFVLKRIDSDAKPDRRCRLLKSDESVATAPTQIRLGLTSGQVTQLLGRPSARSRTVWDFEHSHDESIQKESYTAVNSVYVRFNNGLVTGIQVWKTTSN